MNRFRKSKKGKETLDDPETVPFPALASNPFKKNKKPGLDVKPEFDLASALPSSDDFRTSLLLPKLSARFSMLREQDDPNTKIGKANDDSVLFPKRASKLNLFGHNPSPLTDIAEVASLHGPPSMTLGRNNSFGSGDGDGTEDDLSVNGGVMNRRRPGEGNVLFGGRQKIYKVPVGGSAEGSGLRGRALYEDDVTLLAFQRIRLHVKEEQAEENQVNDVRDSPATEFEDISPGPQTDRTTTSSIASGGSNRRTSTAATSIDEQPLASSQQSSSVTTPNSAASNKPNWPTSGVERNPTKSRRLYGQGLAQTVQEQQSSALSRLETISRQRSGIAIHETPRLTRTFSKSATALNERPPGLSSVQAAPVYQSTAPSLPPYQSEQRTGNFNAKDTTNRAVSPSPGHTLMNALNPRAGENTNEALLAAALQPEDRGKATAMGLFNKPAGSYDEQQFTRRQIQLWEGRNPPPSTRRSPTNSVSQFEQIGRPRGLSNTSYRSRAESASSRCSNETRHNGINSLALNTRDISPVQPSDQSFLTSMTDSEPESDAGRDHSTKVISSSKSSALDSIHPAFRSRPVSRESDRPGPPLETPDIPEVRYSDLTDLNKIAESPVVKTPPSPILEEAPEKAVDTPILRPPGPELNGLIRSHLRNDSDRSSIYPPPMPVFSPKMDSHNTPLRPVNGTARTSNPPVSTHSNPWEYDDFVNKRMTPAEGPPALASQSDAATATSNMSMRAKQILDQAAALRNLQMDSRAGTNWRRPSYESSKPTHRRDGSTETQKDREEFANELAERRRKVQEKLKSFSEIESRSNSPVLEYQPPEFNPVKSGNAFAMLKNKKPAQAKAIKTPGLGNTALSASTPSLIADDSWREEARAFRPLGQQHLNSSAPHIAVTGKPNAPGSSGPPAIQNGSNGSRNGSQDLGMSRDPSPSQYDSRQRDRSTSASERSKSRPRAREDLRMIERNTVVLPEASALEEIRSLRRPPSVSASTRPSTEVNDRNGYERSSSAASGRYRSNSRPAPASGNLDARLLPPISPGALGPSPRSSPVTPYSANATPPLSEPNFESPATATLGAHNIPQRTPGSMGLQKRVVNKSQISEPTLVSTTSNIPTVGLPPGARLGNGIETPPVPPMNPRRRRPTATQTVIGVLKGEKSGVPAVPFGNEGALERSTFSDDDEKKAPPRQRLRKTPSEGAGMHAKARQQAKMAASPAIPQFPKATVIEGGMI